MINLLNKLDLPSDIHDLSIHELKSLASEIREVIMDIVPKTGGHMGTNLGVVELTIALHKCFNLKKDRLLFDVGHQAYPHKLLTGRYKDFHKLRQKDGLCGFPDPNESSYDCFMTGHAGTSISSAIGMTLGYDALYQKKRVIAMIGDGSICGLSFEGLNQAGALKKDMIVILNDNKMAISPTVGAFSKYLNKVRSGELYHTLIKEIKEGLHHIPVVGETLEELSEKTLLKLRDNLLPDRFFTELGFKYYGPVDGHDLNELITLLDNVKHIEGEGPILIHVLTEKGKGATGAEKDPYKFHSPPSSKPKNTIIENKPVGYSQCFVDALLNKANEDESIMAITAAMIQGTKLESFFKKHPERAIDTGIAEGHAVTMAGGISYAGMKPVVMIYSTFLQRAYDNIMHDICLQDDISAVFAIDRAGLVGDDGASHHGVFDISYLRHLPRMIVLAPKDGVELEAMFNWALKQKDPVAMRYPRGNAPILNMPPQCEPIELGKPEVLFNGKKVCLLPYGAMVAPCIDIVNQLKEEGIEVGLINLRFAKPLCKDTFTEMVNNYDTIITLEDHALSGGVGSAILEMINEHDLDLGKLIRLGIPDHFVTFASREEQFKSIGLDNESIIETIKKAL